MDNPQTTTHQSEQDLEEPVDSAGEAATADYSSPHQHDEEPRTGSFLPIEAQPYCSHACLLGLAHGGQMDLNCPNVNDYWVFHLDRLEFMRYMHVNLDSMTTHKRHFENHPHCLPLGLEGLVGALHKVCLPSHGYTLVIKVTYGRDNMLALMHEWNIYDHVLRGVQGIHVPVCVGVLDGGVNNGLWPARAMLFLSYAGEHIEASGVEAGAAVASRYAELHCRNLLHHGAERRNILHDKTTGKVMVIDFEKAELCGPIIPRIIPGFGKRRITGHQDRFGLGEAGGDDESKFIIEMVAVLGHFGCRPFYFHRSSEGNDDTPLHVKIFRVRAVPVITAHAKFKIGVGMPGKRMTDTCRLQTIRPQGSSSTNKLMSLELSL